MAINSNDVRILTSLRTLCTAVRKVLVTKYSVSAYDVSQRETAGFDLSQLSIFNSRKKQENVKWPARIKSLTLYFYLLLFQHSQTLGTHILRF